MEAPESGQNNGYAVASSNGDAMTQSTKYPFYVTFVDGTGLMLGQHLYIELDVGQYTERDGIWISSYYIVQDGDDAYVWAANDRDQLEKRSVTLGMKDEATEEYQITEGLTAQDYIAIPEEGLTEGRSVTRFDDASFGGGADMPADGGMEVLPEEGADAVPEEDVEVLPEGDGAEALPEGDAAGETEAGL